MPPSEAGGGSLGQGGNCLGTVRKCGQAPERARVAVFVAVGTREASWEGERSEGIST